jgi:7-carboxy-7-deazaguanine synthase
MMKKNDGTAGRGDARELSPVLAGHLSEMFCSLQGEGLFVGERQVFVRTAGCAATCSWCDTVYSKVRTPRFVTHHDDGSGKQWRPNPVAIADAVGDVAAFARAHRVESVSITGGEPLEQAEFVAALARDLRARGLRIHLETAGLHGDALRRVIDHVDVVAMDIKLPSATGVEHWNDHRGFLETIRASRTPARVVFVKVVVDPNASLAEIERAAGLVAEFDRSIAMVIQPESGALFGRGTTREKKRALLELVDAGARAAAAHLDMVRVIPQTHKVLHIR